MQAIQKMNHHWDVWGVTAPGQFRVTSPYGGGFGVTTVTGKDELAVVVTPAGSPDPVIGLRLPWSKAGVPAPVDHAAGQFTWSTSEDGQYGYLATFDLVVSLKQEADGVVIDVTPTDGSEVLASTWVTYDEIAFAGERLPSDGDTDIQALYGQVEDETP